MPMIKFKNSNNSFFNSFKFLHLFIFAALVSLFFIFTNCAPPSHDEVASEKIGNYVSPFAKDKLVLQTPNYKIVRTKTAAKREVFNAEQDAIPSSVIVSMSCAAEACAQISTDNVGRLSCFGYNQALKQKWPAQVNRYSFTFKFKKGESLDDIRSKFESDAIDQRCIVGIADYAEFQLTDRLNDPDIALSNSTYAASPYLDQINFFNQQDFIYSLKPSLQKIRIGIVDGDFTNNYSDLNSSSYSTSLQNYYLNFRIDGSIINVGGAPLPSSCASGCHGTWVSQLIIGTNGNGTFGAGIAAGPAADYPDSKIVATNIYSIDPSSGAKIITVDSVNNALSLLSYLKVDVINMSLAYEDKPGKGPASLLATILSAIGQGSVVVVSAGNNGVNMTTKKRANGTDATTLSYPAAWGADYMGLISVAALNSSGSNVALFSNYGAANVEIAAPGENLMIGGKSMSGTSFSAPIVSASVALAKAYYRSQMGDQVANISPAQIELSFLAGAKFVDDIKLFIKNGAVLDLSLLQQQLTTQTISQTPTAKLDTDGFWYTRDGSSMTYGIRTVTTNIPDDEGSLFIGIWEKMDMNLPPLAQFNATNGVNNFELPFYHFVVGDEGFWVVLYRIGATGARIPVTSKLYKFTDLITEPSVNSAVVEGGINQINTDVSGWACLKGRPDRIQVEVRSGSPTGPKIISQQVSHQPKGRDYFDTCSPFTVRLGFNFPITFFQKNVPYYFVAVHPTDGAKNKLLSANPFIIEDTQYSDPVAHTIKKTIDNDKIVVSGQVCWVDQTAPGIISNYVEPLLYDHELGLNPKVKTWLEDLLQNQTTLYSNYTEVVQYVDGSGQPKIKTGRFTLNGWKFGHNAGAFSMSEGDPVGTYSFSPMTAPSSPVKFKTVPFNDAIPLNWGYGIMPIVYVNHPDGKKHYADDAQTQFLYQELKPFFVDSWQPSGIDEPYKTVASYGSDSQRKTNDVWLFGPEKKPVNYQYFGHPTPITKLAAWDVPNDYFGSQLSTAESSAACSSINKTGVGQSFTITQSRTNLMNDFYVGTNLENGLFAINFDGRYTDAQLKSMFDAFNTSYKSALATSGQQLGKSIIDSGQVIFNLRFLSVTSGAKFERFYLKDIPNR